MGSGTTSGAPASAAPTAGATTAARSEVESMKSKTEPHLVFVQGTRVAVLFVSNPGKKSLVCIFIKCHAALICVPTWSDCLSKTFVCEVGPPPDESSAR